MKHTLRIFWSWLCKSLRRQFFTGFLVVVPVGATILILVWIFTTIDNILQPLIQFIFGRPVLGIGFGITIVLIYLVGVVAGNIGGKRLIRYGESLLAKVPVVRPLYNSIKEIVNSFSSSDKTGFVQTVLVEFPRKGIWTVGFITNESRAEAGETQLNIFIPTSPNPTSGFLQIVRQEEVIRTDIPVDDALKMVVSAGKVSPKGITERLSVNMK